MTTEPAALSAAGAETRREPWGVLCRILRERLSAARMESDGGAWVSAALLSRLLAALSGERPAPGALELDPESIAANAVQSLADSAPDGDTTEAQELLQGTPFESMFVVHGHVIERHVASAVENALNALDALSGAAPGAEPPSGWLTIAAGNERRVWLTENEARRYQGGDKWIRVIPLYERVLSGAAPVQPEAITALFRARGLLDTKDATQLEAIRSINRALSLFADVIRAEPQGLAGDAQPWPDEQQQRRKEGDGWTLRPDGYLHPPTCACHLCAPQQEPEVVWREAFLAWSRPLGLADARSEIGFCAGYLAAAPPYRSPLVPQAAPLSVREVAHKIAETIAIHGDQPPDLPWLEALIARALPQQGEVERADSLVRSLEYFRGLAKELEDEVVELEAARGEVERLRAALSGLVAAYEVATQRDTTGHPVDPRVTAARIILAASEPSTETDDGRG